MEEYGASPNRRIPQMERRFNTIEESGTQQKETKAKHLEVYDVTM